MFQSIIAFGLHRLLALKFKSLQFLYPIVDPIFLLFVGIQFYVGPSLQFVLNNAFIGILIFLDIYTLTVGLPEDVERKLQNVAWNTNTPGLAAGSRSNNPFVADFNGKSFNIKTFRGSKGISKELYLKELSQKNIYVQEINIDQLHFLSQAEILDRKWSHVTRREEFLVPENKLYLCGNSLGLQPKQTRELINEELDKWANYAVDGHFTGKRPWFEIESFLVDKMARLVGAKSTEIAVMNSLSANVHLLMVPFYRPTAKKFKILIEENPFPSDMYIFTSHLRTRGIDPSEALIQVGARKGEEFIRTEDIIDVLEKEGDSIALVLLSGIQFISGQAFEIKRITEAGHKHNCIVGFDLAHAAGNINLQLHNDGCDFATWCSYKYINSGPGNLSCIFVHEKHAKSDLFRYAGWWGHKRETRFQLKNKFEAQEGAAGFQLSNPPVIAMMGIFASLNVFDSVGIENLRQKSYRLTTYLELLLKEYFTPEEVVILTPPDPSQRGCQISVRVPVSVSTVMKMLEERNVICDSREPGIIRIAPTPLYNTFQDVYNFIKIFRQILDELL